MEEKEIIAKRPPMGWNSWDCYGAAVNEEQLLGNAKYMAENLKDYGWEYVICDIQWYEPTADSHQYHKFTELEMDEYSRLIPAVDRFPSSAGGKGFGPIAEQIHEMGLKFGIHIMRGIPRFCAAEHRQTLCGITADRIANPFSISKWNGDMYGVDASRPGAQEYYDSIFALYAEWGVDFVKVDDICNTNMYPHDPYSAEKEVELIARAIARCGRPMVLSLSPGPAVIEKAWHLEKYANMWRITDDFWDTWPLLLAMFERCELWQKHVGGGCWPDCDMLPLGRLCKGWGEERGCRFTPDEQRTMLTLWCIFRSPLMIGADLPRMDDATKALLTNREVLGVQRHSRGAVQVLRDGHQCVWASSGAGCPARGVPVNVALFNLGDAAGEVSVRLPDIPHVDASRTYRVRDLWEQRDLFPLAGDAELSLSLPAHGAALLRLSV